MGATGHENHRHFFLFMWYIWCGVWYVAGVAYTPYNARSALRKRMREAGEMQHWREELVHEGTSSVFRSAMPLQPGPAFCTAPLLLLPPPSPPLLLPADLSLRRGRFFLGFSLFRCC